MAAQRKHKTNDIVVDMLLVTVGCCVDSLRMTCLIMQRDKRKTKNKGVDSINLLQMPPSCATQNTTLIYLFTSHKHKKQAEILGRTLTMGFILHITDVQQHFICGKKHAHQCETMHEMLKFCCSICNLWSQAVKLSHRWTSCFFSTDRLSDVLQRVLILQVVELSERLESSHA